MFWALIRYSTLRDSTWIKFNNRLGRVQHCVIYSGVEATWLGKPQHQSIITQWFPLDKPGRYGVYFWVPQLMWFKDCLSFILELFLTTAIYCTLFSCTVYGYKTLPRYWPSFYGPEPTFSSFSYFYFKFYSSNSCWLRDPFLPISWLHKLNSQST